jgi:hypothetical protein
MFFQQRSHSTPEPSVWIQRPSGIACSHRTQLFCRRWLLVRSGSRAIARPSSLTGLLARGARRRSRASPALLTDMRTGALSSSSGSAPSRAPAALGAADEADDVLRDVLAPPMGRVRSLSSDERPYARPDVGRERSLSSDERAYGRRPDACDAPLRIRLRRGDAGSGLGGGDGSRAALNLSKKAMRGVLGDGAATGESCPRGMNGADVGTTAGLREACAGATKSSGECGDTGEYEDWLPSCGESGGVRAAVQVVSHMSD